MPKILSRLYVIQPLVILLILTSTFLTSCSHIKRHDGPPNYYVDETVVPNAVPKPEPLAKYGNMHSYNVFGKRYYTLRSSKNYVQVGVASWYGTSFHARNTSSGEPYDMLAMTAAHKSLPLPTYVEVTNLQNNRKIIVKVNDRGPFSSNRIIDLSYVAAKKLGMLAKGTAKVRIKAINPYTYGKKLGDTTQIWVKNKSKKRAGINIQKGFYLQVGAFEQKHHATQLKAKLMKSIDAPIKITLTRSGDKLYRVQIGPLRDASSAEEMTARLKNFGITPNRLYGT